MAKITTDDCKDFILTSFNLSSTSSIKRIRKYKNTDGLIVRDFLINGETSCSLLENANGSLALIPTDTSRPVAAFDPKKFLKAYQKSYENSDDTDDVVAFYIKKINDLSSEDKYRFASLITFCFPNDVYNNISSSVTKGFNTPMFNPNDSASYCFVVYCSEFEDIYISDIIRPLLPFYFTAVDEEHFELFVSDFMSDSSDDITSIIHQYGLDDLSPSISSEERKRIKRLTLGDVYNQLVSIGFKHQTATDDSHDPCMLRILGLVK